MTIHPTRGRGHDQGPGPGQLCHEAQTRSRQYILACGDGNFYLDKLNWAAWGSSSAFAEGIKTFNDCVPFCPAGHFHSFPALVALWRAEPRPGHVGQRYFTRLTLIYTGLD